MYFTSIIGFCETKVITSEVLLQPQERWEEEGNWLIMAVL